MYSYGKNDTILIVRVLFLPRAQAAQQGSHFVLIAQSSHGKNDAVLVALSWPREQLACP